VNEYGWRMRLGMLPLQAACLIVPAH